MVTLAIHCYCVLGIYIYTDALLGHLYPGERRSMLPVKYEFAQHPPPDQTRNQTHKFLVTSPTPTSCPFGHESTCSNLSHMHIGRSRGKKVGVGGMCPHNTILFSRELCQKFEQRMNRSLVYEHPSHLLWFHPLFCLQYSSYNTISY